MSGALSTGGGRGLLAGLSEIERDAASLGLLALFKRQAALFSGGDSSSLRVETARELLASIEFALSEYLAETGLSRGELFRSDLEAALAAGRRIIEKKRAGARALWQRACLGAPAFASSSLSDTLRGIGVFWRRYDLRFFAAQTPCDIDYQLCVPISEGFEGVNLIGEYLRRLAAENDLLARFDPRRCAEVLSAVMGDYKESVANLYEPVLTNALGLALIERDPLALDITQKARAAIASRLVSLGTTAPDALGAAALALCDALGVSEDFTRAYSALSARRLWPRISLALERGGLEGVFPSCWR